MEKWKDIPEYEGRYKISSLGRVKSYINNFGKKYKTPKMLSISVNKGYCFVRLQKNGTVKNKLVHRLVAQSFIPNPDNKKEVNHINGDKSDNRLDNLEWSTRSENISHMYKELGYKACGGLGKKKTMCIETGTIYGSLMEAGRKTGIDFSLIGRVCRGELSQTNGYHWKYIN